MPPIDRRRFLAGATRALLAAGVAPLFIPRRARAALGAGPNSTVQVACIGVGGRGAGLLENALGVKSARVVALCDPFRSRREAAAATVVNRYGPGSAPALFNDYRDLLADPAVDAVIVATPDHWHSAISREAVRRGKAVYCEKPLAKSLEQNRALRELVQTSGAIFQYGTQQRSMAHCRRAVELVRRGFIGELQRVEVWCSGSPKGGDATEVPVPEGLDWDLYCGPSALAPCQKARLSSPGTWYHSDYSLGFVAGWGAHPLDLAIWGIDSDLAGPFQTSGRGTFPASGFYDTLVEWETETRFADGVTLRFISYDHIESVRQRYGPTSTVEGARDGTVFVGSGGWVSVSRGGISASNPDWLRAPLPEEESRVRYHPNFMEAFVHAARDRSATLSDIAGAARSDALSHLSNLVARTGQSVTWDPAAYRFVAPEGFESHRHLATRGPWPTT
jgi:predicted dehydrogenase